MKKRTRVIVLSIIGLIIVLFLLVCNNINNSIEASKPIITEDISENATALLLDEFGICLPPEAEITAFSFTKEQIIIRIEGVEDLPTFLVESLCLGINEGEAEKNANGVYLYFDYENNPYKDMYGIDHQSSGFSTSEYPACPIDSFISFFLLDEKLAIEMRKSNISLENRDELWDMVNN